MAQVNVRIENLDKFLKAMQQSPAIVGKHLQRGVQKATLHFLAATKDNIRTSRNMWKAPIDTGYMWNTLFTSIYPFRGEIIPTANYAVFVHEGTFKMEARPFFDITEQTDRGKLEKIFADELNAAMQEVARG